MGTRKPQNLSIKTKPHTFDKFQSLCHIPGNSLGSCCMNRDLCSFLERHKVHILSSQRCFLAHICRRMHHRSMLHNFVRICCSYKHCPYKSRALSGKGRISFQSQARNFLRKPHRFHQYRKSYSSSHCTACTACPMHRSIGLLHTGKRKPMQGSLQTHN